MIDEEGRLRRIDYGDRVYFDSVLGIAGTTYPIGTAEVPSDVIANAIAICVAQNINKINVVGTLAIGAGIAQDLVGHNSILTGQTAGAAYVREISGYLEIDAMVGGTLDIYAHGAEIQINADCTAGTINIYGVANVTDNSAAGCTVNDYTVPYAIDAMRGGAETLESLDDELDAIVDAAEVRSIDSPVTLTNVVQYIYTNSPGRPFYFAGGFVNRASGAWATGESVTVNVEVQIDGATWIEIWTITFAAEPSPVLAAIPSHANSALLNLPYGFWNKGDGVRVGIVQTVVGAGYHTWDHSFIDAVPST